VRAGGKAHAVRGSLRLGSRTFPIIDYSAREDRIVYRGHDPHAGPGGDLCSIHQFPYSREAIERVNLIARITRDNESLPKITYWYPSVKRGVFVVLSWKAGRTLESFLSGSAWLSATESVRLYRGLAHVLSQLHKRFIHGDVSPNNLILTEGGARRLALIDFGTAWISAQARTRPPGDGNTLAYASPEVLGIAGYAAAEDFRSDQFSATVVLYRMLTRELPYDGYGGRAAEFPEVAAHYVPPSRLSHDRKRLPSDVWQSIDAMCLKGLQLRRDDRYATSREWLDTVDAVHNSIRHSSKLKPLDRAIADAVGWVADRFKKS
jgi:serine/threonine protein kinase